MGEEGKKGKSSASTPEETLSNWFPEGNLRSADREMVGTRVECIAAASSLVRWGGSAAALGGLSTTFVWGLLPPLYSPKCLEEGFSRKFAPRAPLKIRNMGDALSFAKALSCLGWKKGEPALGKRGKEDAYGGLRQARSVRYPR